MCPDEVAKSRSIADRAMDAMQRMGVRPTPANYAIWYEYHAGQSPNLQRTIDVLLSNGALFDEGTLQDLYSTFFSSAKEAQAVRHTSILALTTLQDIVGVAHLAHQDANQFGAALRGLASKDLEKGLENLRSLIENLVDETKDMAGRTEYVGLRMRESAERIEALERNLETALRDSTLDGLTGVPNRKSFDSFLRKSAGEAMNSGDDLTLLMIDIDHFKNVNDTWGHPVGDSVLRHLAKTLTMTVRGGDYVARYGGEEFAIILPRTDIESAISVAENIRGALAREHFPITVEPPLKPITVSIGAACYEPGESLTDWVAKSDSALYRAKREGRNRVECDRVCR